jgi:hypothetical protein
MRWDHVSAVCIFICKAHVLGKLISHLTVKYLDIHPIELETKPSKVAYPERL